MPAPRRRPTAESSSAVPPYNSYFAAWRLFLQSMGMSPRMRRAAGKYVPLRSGNDSALEALMFCHEAGVPFRSRNWLKRRLQPVGKKLGIAVPLTFQVLRRSFATHNQSKLKDVQAHLGHENVATTANLYVQEVPAEVRRTQDTYTAAIDNWKEPKAPRVSTGEPRKSSLPKS
jgi:hypothetical protein